MGDTFADIGDIVFTLVIGYISAIEFLYVVRHLYHYSFNHDANDAGIDNAENLSQLQDSMRQQLANAQNKEAEAGTQVMKDGVPYKDGFRLEVQQTLIDQLKEQLRNKELSDLRRKELEKELAIQNKIAEKLRKELAEAEAKYQLQLKNAKDAEARKLLEKQKQEERAKREAEEQERKLIEAEKQKETEQKRKEEQEAIKKETERKQREEQERKEAENQALKLAELEKQREMEQRKREEQEQREMEEIKRQETERKEAEENDRRLQEAEIQRQNIQRKLEEEEAEQQVRLEIERKKQEERHREELEMAEAEENARRIFEMEKAKEQNQAAKEASVKKLLEMKHRLEEQLRAAEKEAELTDNERTLIESIKKRSFDQEEGNERKEAELLQRILQAREQLGEESEEEQTFRLIQRERDQEAKQRRIEENALLFMEAEKEMADLQSKMLEVVENKYIGNLDSAPHTPVTEEPCIKRSFSPLTSGESSHSTVKTQLAQDLHEPYTVRTKPLLFPGVSDDASSIDPASSQQSSFSTQPSEEIMTGTESQYLAQERQEPDGEDGGLSHIQYSDDYLRSLDGIKQRPLMREDGSGRRRAFKKRRSSNSSNSSRESRHSRDEELKMFTSLEEEEMKDNADSEYTPIRYTTEPTLKVKGHHRRHKRSPAKDMRRSDDSLRSSLECLGEETSDPWGEVKPEHYKNTEFWKREKKVSIDEEMEYEKPASSEEVAYDTATNMPSASSFEEATQLQNKEAMTALQKNSTKGDAQKRNPSDPTAAKDETPQNDNTNT